MVSRIRSLNISICPTIKNAFGLSPTSSAAVMADLIFLVNLGYKSSTWPDSIPKRVRQHPACFICSNGLSTTLHEMSMSKVSCSPRRRISESRAFLFAQRIYESDIFDTKVTNEVLYLIHNIFGRWLRILTLTKCTSMWTSTRGNHCKHGTHDRLQGRACKCLVKKMTWERERLIKLGTLGRHGSAFRHTLIGNTSKPLHGGKALSFMVSTMQASCAHLLQTPISKHSWLIASCGTSVTPMASQMKRDFSLSNPIFWWFQRYGKGAYSTRSASKSITRCTATFKSSAAASMTNVPLVEHPSDIKPMEQIWANARCKLAFPFSTESIGDWSKQYAWFTQKRVIV